MIEQETLEWIILTLYVVGVAISIAAIFHRDEDVARTSGANTTSGYPSFIAQIANVAPFLSRASAGRYAQLRNYSPFRSANGRFLIFGLALIIAATALTYLDLE